jgi:hypothetical protein
MTAGPGYSLKVTVIVTVVFTWLAFITRLTVRLRTVRRFYLDDWLVMLSMVGRLSVKNCLTGHTDLLQHDGWTVPCLIMVGLGAPGARP